MAKALEDEIGDILRKLRTEKEFSQETLANLCDLERTYISQIERGLKMPTVATIFKISRALDIKPSEFIRLVEEKK